MNINTIRQKSTSFDPKAKKNTTIHEMEKKKKKTSIGLTS